MRYSTKKMKVSLQIFLVVAAVAAAVTTAHFLKNDKNRHYITDLKNLSTWDKAKFFMARILTPQVFKGMPKGAFAELQGYDMWPEIDSFFIDARQLFTQAKKISPTANLPELRWGFRLSFCLWTWCIDDEITYSTKDSRIIGGENISSKTIITPTTITNVFDIPFFNWTSPGFKINVTDYINQKIHLTERSFYAFENTTLAFTSNYGFVPDVGIQLDNLSIHYDAGKVRGAVQELTVWDFDGNLLDRWETDPEDFKIDEYMMSDWSRAKRDYTSGLQYSLNCFLSNGRSDPENCLYGDNNDYYDNLTRDYYKFLNMQLIQTIGLGALLE